MERPRILVADEASARRAARQGTLEDNGFEFLGAPTWAEAVDLARRKAVHVLLADERLPSWPGPVAAARSLPTGSRSVALVILADHGGRPRPSGSQPGIFDVLPTEVDADRLLAAVHAAVRHAKLVREVGSLRERLRGREGYDRLVGRSPGMERLRSRLERIADSDGPVLLVGEDGTGRSLAARTLHGGSARRAHPFVTVHARAFPDDRVGVELLGTDDRGADGAFAAADSGTVFVDEIVAVPVDVQVRLAECLARERGPGARLVASTSWDVDRAEREGRLDPALALLLRPESIGIPPLRERLEDVPLLARHFLDAIAEVNGLGPWTPSPDALAALARHGWPGNVRELRDSLEHAAILCEDGRIRASDLPESVLGDAGPVALVATSAAAVPFRRAKQEVVAAFERRYLTDLMIRQGGNVTAAAEQAGMLRSALQRLLRKHGLRSSEFRGGRGGVAARRTHELETGN